MPAPARKPWSHAGWAADLRYALRGIRRYPAFSSTVVATLAVGIGINAAVFAIASAFLLRGFPLVDSNERILYIGSRNSACCISYPDFEDLRAQAASFEGIEVVHGFAATLTDPDGFAEVFDVTEVSAGTFALIGRPPLIGRDFTRDDESPGAARVTILSHGFWERRYARDPNVLGRTIELDGAPATIVGVMPPAFSFPQKQALWLPLVPTAEVRQRDNRDLWFAFGRVREGVTLETARAEIDTLGRRLAAEYPLTNQDDDLPTARTFNEFFIGGGENEIYGSMWGGVLFVLLIACANLANLTLARAIGRSREISVRIALGASRVRIVRQLLTESVLLAAVGAALGWWLAEWAVRLYALAAHGPGLSPWRVLDYTMDARVLLYVTVVAIVTGLLFGLAPASRLSRLDVNGALKEGGRGATAGARVGRLSNLLVIAQVALAVVLLAGAGVMIRSFVNVATSDPGIVTDGVSTAFVSLPEAAYPSGARQAAFYDELDRQLEAVAGVESVAFVNVLPTLRSALLPYELGDDPRVDAATRPRVSTLVASPAYFETLGAAILAGRGFNDTDRADSLAVVIVNQRFADLHWPGEEPLGRRVRIFDQSGSTAAIVIGVASNIVQNDPTRQTVEPVVYLPYRQQPRGGMWILLRAALPPESIAAALRQEIRALDADLPIRFGPHDLADRLSEVYADRTLYVIVFLLFAGIALLLAAVGLYAVVAHSVSRHTKEIGLRMALGATTRDILRLVLEIGLVPIGIGLGLGIVLALVLTRTLQSELVGVSPADPVAYVLACVVLGAAAALGCLLPARRAIRVDPVVALRND